MKEGRQSHHWEAVVADRRQRLEEFLHVERRPDKMVCQFGDEYRQPPDSCAVEDDGAPYKSGNS